MNRFKMQIRWLPVMILVVFMVGCASDYGRLKKSDDVLKAFKNYDMLADYRYFYSGRENKPSAIIGVSPEYEFSSRFWTEIEDDESFRKQVDRMYPMTNWPEFAAYIHTSDGERVGVWFSGFNATVVKRDGDRLIVYSPENMTEEVRGGKDDSGRRP